MIPLRKRQVCFRISESIVKELEETREKTGVPVSTQIELRLKGYEIVKEMLSTEERASVHTALCFYADSKHFRNLNEESKEVIRRLIIRFRRRK